MQMEMMNRHNVRQDNGPYKMPTSTVVARVDCRARDVWTMLFEKKLFYFVQFLDYGIVSLLFDLGFEEVSKELGLSNAYEAANHPKSGLQCREYGGTSGSLVPFLA